MFLDLDSWMVRLFGSETRPKENVVEWYLERKERCSRLMWDLALELLSAGVEVYLELGLVTTAERAAVYARAHEEALKLAVYFLDAPRELRRERVTARNTAVRDTAVRNTAAGPHTQVVPLEFFEKASDLWEPPTEAERSHVNLIDV